MNPEKNTFGRIQKLLDRGELRKAQKMLAFLEGDEKKVFAAEIARREDLLAEEKKGITITIERCPHCGASFSEVARPSKTLVCGSCATVIDGKTAEEKGNGGVSGTPFSFLALGKTATIEGVKYQIVGRTRTHTYGKEWDAEDGEYTRLDWTADEWVMRGENGHYLFLQDDADGFFLSERFLPKHPVLPIKYGDRINFMDGRARRIDEMGERKTLFLEGEFPWRAKVGRRVSFAEYSFGDTIYSAEWSVSSKNMPTEIEFYRGKKVEEMTVLKMFHEQELLAKKEAVFQKKQDNKKKAKWFWVASAIIGFLFFTSLSDGKTVFSESVTMAEIPEEGKVLGPFLLKSIGDAHKIEMHTTFSRDAWNWVGVELLDANKNPINTVQKEFWKESGYDSDGSWEESETSESLYFRLEKKGEYFLRLFGKKGTSAPSTVTRVIVTEKETLSRYYVIAFILLLSTAFSLQRGRKFSFLSPLFGLFLFLFSFSFFFFQKDE